MSNKKAKNGKPNNLVFEARLGAIRLTIWENGGKDDSVFYNVNIVRRFKSGDDEWSSTSSFTGLSDLALVSEATRMAQGFLRSQAFAEEISKKAA